MSRSCGALPRRRRPRRHDTSRLERLRIDHVDAIAAAGVRRPLDVRVDRCARRHRASPGRTCSGLVADAAHTRVRTVRAATNRGRRGRRVHPLHVAGMATRPARSRRDRDRRHVAVGRRTALPDQHRGQAAAAHPRVRRVGGSPCRDLHGRPQRAQSSRDRAARRDVRRGAAPTPGVHRCRGDRDAPGHGDLLDHRRRMARHPVRPRCEARPAESVLARLRHTRARRRVTGSVARRAHGGRPPRFSNRLPIPPSARSWPSAPRQVCSAGCSASAAG